MRRVFFLFLCGSLACGGQSATPSNTGGSGGQGGGAPGMGGGGSGGGVGGMGGGAGSAEIACDGIDHLTCPAGFFCGDGACGLTGSRATCSPLPTNCPLDGVPVCGCDGKVYANGCQATLQGQGRCFDGVPCGFDISNDIKCEPPAGDFACGTFFCAHGREYCERSECIANWQLGRCKPLPTSCGAAATCNCVKVDGYTCASTPAGDVTLTRLTGPDFCIF